jgi:hypothetical protein
MVDFKHAQLHLLLFVASRFVMLDEMMQHDDNAQPLAMHMQRQPKHAAELAEHSVSAVHVQALRKVEKAKGWILGHQTKLAAADKESNM